MSDHLTDAEPAHDGEQRSTNQGRQYGSISYPADADFAPDDLRRRSSSGMQAPLVNEHWTERPSRSTGSRRRIL